LNTCRATQQGVAVIPKSNNFERLKSNLDCMSFELTEQELKDISALNVNLRVRSFTQMPSQGLTYLI
jgi:diketogulonate reductase-like aldo/keto reductase